jgi:hypothetical protein
MDIEFVFRMRYRRNGSFQVAKGGLDNNTEACRAKGQGYSHIKNMIYSMIHRLQKCLALRSGNCRHIHWCVYHSLVYHMEAGELGSTSTGKGDALVQAIWGEIGKSGRKQNLFQTDHVDSLFHARQDG